MDNISIISLFRCTTRRYAEKFCNEGSIKFNTPYSWIQYEKEHSKGRGDLLEGVLRVYIQIAISIIQVH